MTEKQEAISLWKKGDTVNFYTPNDEKSGRIPILNVEKWEDFIDLINDKFFNEQGNELIFRGQRRYDWGLIPNIARHTSNYLFTEDLANTQLINFKRAIRGRIKDHSLILNDDGESDNEIWAIGQHYGLNTPLLDWTFSPYVALFFAFSKKDVKEEKPNEYRAIYIANRTLLAKQAKIEFFEPKIDMYGRLVNQAGLFIKAKPEKTIEGTIIDSLYSDDNNNDIDLVDEEDFENELAKYICKIYIKNNEENQRSCIYALKQMNIHYANLFPDLLGAADYCNMLSEMISYKNKNVTKIDISNLLPNRELILEASDLLEPNENDINNVQSILSKYLTLDNLEMRTLSKNIIDEIEKNKTTDWNKKDSIKAKIRISWKRLLKLNNISEDKLSSSIKELSELYGI